MLNEPMKWIIRNFSVGMVATVNDAGEPAVSPKATFVILDDSTIAFGDIRSPGTVSNLTKRPATEINFVDILNRKAVRIRGTASVITRESGGWAEIASVFEENWETYIHLIKNFVVIKISAASMVISPAYDVGLGAAELHKSNLAKLNSLSSS